MSIPNKNVIVFLLKTMFGKSIYLENSAGENIYMV